MGVTGMPEEAIAAMRETPAWPGLVAVAPTLAYDSAVMGDLERGGAVPEDLAAAAGVPGLVVVGDENPPEIVAAAGRLADLLPDGSLRVLPGEGHVVAPDVLAPIVASFLNEA